MNGKCTSSRFSKQGTAIYDRAAGREILKCQLVEQERGGRPWKGRERRRQPLPVPLPCSRWTTGSAPPRSLSAGSRPRATSPTVHPAASPPLAARVRPSTQPPPWRPPLRTGSLPRSRCRIADRSSLGKRMDKGRILCMRGPVFSPNTRRRRAKHA